MTIIILIITHWYLSLFFQTFFLHRYAGHRHFTMSRCWEKFFYVTAWLIQGFTALSPYAYGVMHRIHHAHTDTAKDAHSPHHDKHIPAMLCKTHRLFRAIRFGTINIERRFTKGLPNWSWMENHAYTLRARLLWGSAIVILYYFLVPSNQTWLWMLLPLHFLMSPLQAVIINWFAHLVGYRNYKIKDRSRNILPIDVLMLGEAYHNNHHARPGKVSFGKKWHEVDPVYLIILVFNFFKIIRIKTSQNEGQ